MSNIGIKSLSFDVSLMPGVTMYIYFPLQICELRMMDVFLALRECCCAYWLKPWSISEPRTITSYSDLQEAVLRYSDVFALCVKGWCLHYNVLYPNLLLLTKQTTTGPINCSVCLYLCLRHVNDNTLNDKLHLLFHVIIVLAKTNYIWHHVVCFIWNTTV